MEEYFYVSFCVAISFFVKIRKLNIQELYE